MRKIYILFMSILCSITLIAQNCIEDNLIVSSYCIDESSFGVRINFNGENGETYIVSDNLGSQTMTVSAPISNYQFGVYPSESPINVIITITLESDLDCVYTSNSLNSNCNGFAICNENITLSSQTAVDNFVSIYGCSEIQGNLTISGSDIYNLDGLINVTSVTGNLYIQYNQLENFEGLNNLDFIGRDLIIRYNDSLTNVIGLESLVTVGGRVEIYSNESLITLEGLNNLESILGAYYCSYSCNNYNGSLQIYSNTSLQNLDGLNNLTYIEDFLTISSNSQLENIDALSNLQTVDAITINSNPFLANIDGLEGVNNLLGSVSISNNEILNNINGLSQFNTLSGDLVIHNNANLSNISGLSNVDMIQGNLTISNNSLLVNIDDLNSLLFVDGYIQINDNSALTNISGLNNLVSVSGTFSLINNGLLTDISGIEHFTTLGSNLTIQNNDALSDLGNLSNLEIVEGNLTIRDNDGLTSLLGLNGLQTVEGTIDISNNLGLESLEGLSNLDSIIGNLTISNNVSLLSFNSLNSLTYLTGNLSIQNNQQLEYFNGLSSLDSIGRDVSIYNNDSLVDLTSLESLEKIGGKLDIENNDALVNLEGLNNLDSILGAYYCSYSSCYNHNGRLYIRYNSSLQSLQGLNSLTYIEDYMTIDNNIQLVNIDALSNLQTVDAINIHNNAFLVNINGLLGLTNLFGSISISNNETLENIDGLSQFNTLPGDLVINNNANLSNISGLSNIDTIQGSINITENILLSNVDALNSLLQVGANIIISDNDALTNISGLNNLVSVSGTFSLINNSLLTDISGIEHFTTLGSNLTIQNNDALSDLGNLSNLEIVEGNLTIRDNDGLTSLLGLTGLQIVEGTIDISNNLGLESLEGLSNLDSIIGNLTISNNVSLLSFNSLNSLTYLTGNLSIQNNQQLEYFNGLSSLDSIGRDVYIYNNDSLVNLTSLESLEKIGGKLDIENNDALVNLEGLNNLESILGAYYCSYSSCYNHNGRLYIRYNSSLQSLQGLNSLTYIEDYMTIDNNDVLLNLNALSQLNTLDALTISNNDTIQTINGLVEISDIYGNVTISNNPNLNQCCIIECWGTGVVDGTLSVYNNLTNCNSIEEIQDICSASDCENIANQGVCGNYALGAGPYDFLTEPACEGLTLIPGVEVQANESYRIYVNGGANYTFEFCEGYNPNNSDWNGEAIISVGYDNSSPYTQINDLNNLIADTIGCSIDFSAPYTGWIIVVINDGECSTTEYIESPNGNITLTTNIGLECTDCQDDNFTAPNILQPEINSICLNGNYESILFEFDGSQTTGLDPTTTQGQNGYSIVIDLSPLNNFYGTTIFEQRHFFVDEDGGTLQDIQDQLSSTGYNLVPGIYTVLGGGSYTGFVGGNIGDDNTICFTENFDNPTTFEIFSIAENECIASASCINGFLSSVDIILPLPNSGQSGTMPFIASTDCFEETDYIAFYVNGLEIGIDDDADGDGFYEVTVNTYNYEDGIINIEAIATGIDGQNYSTTRNIVINNFGPFIEIVSPQDNSFYSTDIQYDITTNIDEIDPPSSVTFEILDESGMVLFFEEDFILPFEASFNINNFAAGTFFTIRVIAKDEYGKQTINQIGGVVNQPSLLTYTGQVGFENSIVEPDVGTPDEVFYFAVDYYANPDNLPQADYPKLKLNYQGNVDNDYVDLEDLQVQMYEDDPTDQDPSDGKRYYYTTSLLLGENWKAEVEVIDQEDLLLTLGPLNEPDVSNDFLDIAIFASDIEFSDYNPDVEEEITIEATIHNTSDFVAEDFEVALYEEDTYLGSQTIDLLPAQSSTTIDWTHSFATENFFPMKVVIDDSEVLDEKNELNNFAIRPIIVGDYEVPGNIVVNNVSVSPSAVYPSGNITLSGNALYEDVAVNGIDLDVSGSIVQFTIVETGATYSSTLNQDGYFSVGINAPLGLGVYTIEGSVTDYTLTGTFTTTFEVIPVPMSPNLYANLSVSGCIYEGGTFEGTATVSNSGNVASGAFDFKYYACDETLLGSQSIDNLEPNESLIFDFETTFFEEGSCSLTYEIDSNNNVDEFNEGDNNGTRTFSVKPNLPDLTYGGGINWTNIGGSRIVGEDYSFYLRNRNIGGIPSSIYTVQFNIEAPNGSNTIYNYEIADGLEGCGDAKLAYFDHVFPEEGIYTITATIDYGDNINEDDEENNIYVGTVNAYIPVTPEPPTPYSNLAFTGCYQSGHIFEVVPATPTNSGESLVLETTLVNTGTLDVNQSFDVSLSILQGEMVISTTSIMYTNGLSAGEQALVSIPFNAPPFGDYDLKVEIDVAEAIEESSDNDNDNEYPICWDFEPVNICYNWNYQAFWNYEYYEEVPVVFRLGLLNKGLYTAPTVTTRFEIYDENENLVEIVTDVTENISKQLCRSCPFGIGTGAVYAFPNAGIYRVDVYVDSSNEYTECDEDNNFVSHYITINKKLPDLEILSQYISPSELNPDPDEEVTIFINYENIGDATAAPFSVECKVDDILLGNPVMVENQTPPGEEGTVEITTNWSSSILGSHIIRGFLDVNEEVEEIREDNNEAARAIIVGDAANLYFVNGTIEETVGFGKPIMNELDYSKMFTTDCEIDFDGENITANLTFTVKNEGDLNCSGDIVIYSEYEDGELSPPLASTSINILANEEKVVTLSGITLSQLNNKIIGKIINTVPEEYNYEDNSIVITYGNPVIDVVVEIIEIIPPTCTEIDNGSIRVQATGGCEPYSYIWSNNQEGVIVTNLGVGTYTVSVGSITGLTSLDILLEAPENCDDAEIEVGGYITNDIGEGEPLENIIIQFIGNDGENYGSTITDEFGFYSFALNAGWTGTIIPISEDYYFDSPSFQVNEPIDLSDYVNFIGIQPVLEGYVYSSYLEFTPLEGVLITLSNDGGITTTDENGYYSINVSPNWVGQITPSLNNYFFEPSVYEVTDVLLEEEEINFNWYSNNLKGTIVDARISIDESYLIFEPLDLEDEKYHVRLFNSSEPGVLVSELYTNHEFFFTVNPEESYYIYISHSAFEDSYIQAEYNNLIGGIDIEAIVPFTLYSQVEEARVELNNTTEASFPELLYEPVYYNQFLLSGGGQTTSHYMRWANMYGSEQDQIIEEMVRAYITERLLKEFFIDAKEMLDNTGENLYDVVVILLEQLEVFDNIKDGFNNIFSSPIASEANNNLDRTVKLLSDAYNFMTKHFDESASDEVYGVMQSLIAFSNNPEVEAMANPIAELVSTLSSAVMLDYHFIGNESKGTQQMLNNTLIEIPYAFSGENYDYPVLIPIQTTLEGALHIDYGLDISCFESLSYSFNPEEDSRSLLHRLDQNTECTKTIYSGLNTIADALDFTEALKTLLNELRVTDNVASEFIDKFSEGDDLSKLNKLLGFLEKLDKFAVLLKKVEGGIRLGSAGISSGRYFFVREGAQKEIPEYVLKQSSNPCPIDYFASSIAGLESAVNEYSEVLDNLSDNLEVGNIDAISENFDLLYYQDSTLNYYFENAGYPILSLYNIPNNNIVNFDSIYYENYIKNYSESISYRTSLNVRLLAKSLFKIDTIGIVDSIIVTIQELADIHEQSLNQLETIYSYIENTECQAYLVGDSESIPLQVIPDTTYNFDVSITNYGGVNADSVYLLFDTYGMHTPTEDSIFIGSVDINETVSVQLEFTTEAFDTIGFYNISLHSPNAVINAFSGVWLTPDFLDCENIDYLSNIIPSDTSYQVGDTVLLISEFQYEGMSHLWLENNDTISNNSYFNEIAEQTSNREIKLITTTFQGCRDTSIFNLKINLYEDCDTTIDSDLDGIANCIEEQLNLDPNNPDSDDDGLNDGEEITNNTDPTNSDTDEDGINDGEEIEIGTNPINSDSDNDGLDDGDELTNNTDPNNPDSDNDGINDGEEITNGTNPNCDEANPPTWYQDTDEDGLGNPENPIISCEQPEGYTSNSEDINDNCFSNQYDCNNQCDGTAITDGCGICLEPSDPQFDACFCEDFVAISNAICDGDTYQVILSFIGGSPGNNGYNILDYNTGTTFNTSEPNILLGPYPANTGFAFNISVADHPNCFKVVNTAVVSCSVTAIELLSFDGEVREDGNRLSWTTASENESDYFTLERSEDGTNFTAIGDIPSNDNSSTTQSYNYVDKEYTNRIQHYRLRETDKNGISKVVSNVVTLIRGDIQFEILSAAPVPAYESVNIAYTIAESKTLTIHIYDVAGRLVETQKIDAKIGYNDLNLNLKDYTSGTYLLRMIDEDREVSIRFIKAK